MLDLIYNCGVDEVLHNTFFALHCWLALNQIFWELVTENFTTSLLLSNSWNPSFFS